MLQQKKIRVLQCIRQGQIGGGESHLLSLVENLNRSIYEPIVLSFTDGPMVTRLREMNIVTHIIFTEKAFDYKVWKKVSSLLIAEKIQLIHCHGSRAASNIFRSAAALKIPFIYSIHGWSFHDDQHPLIKKLRILSEKFLTSKSDANIAVSASNRNSGKKYIPGFEATVVNNGIDQEKFNPLKEYKNIRSEINISPTAILFIFIARFNTQKQPLSLLKAFAAALKNNTALQLLMVGDGEEKKEAVDLAKELRLEKNVCFLPFRQDVPDLLAAADVFVLPSLWEGLPIGLLEAMSMGKAVIATQVDGSSEIILNNENGLLIKTENLVSNLAEAIVELGKDEQHRNRLGKNAIVTVAKNFNAAGMTRKIENVYENVLENKKVKRAEKIIYDGV